MHHEALPGRFEVKLATRQRGELEGLRQQRGVKPHAQRRFVIRVGESHGAVDDQPAAYTLQHVERFLERCKILLQQSGR
jgi:hypothetical protein